MKKLSRYSVPIVERHIMILERLEKGESKRQISEDTGLSMQTINNTIHNHGENLEYLRQILVEIGRENRQEEPEEPEQTEEVELVQRTNEEQVKLYTKLLDAIYEQGYEYTEQNRDEMIEALKFEGPDDFEETLQALVEGGFIEEMSSIGAESTSIYQVTEAGEPYATGQLRIELQAGLESEEDVESQEPLETESYVEAETSIEEEGEKEGGIELSDEKRELLLELSQEVRRQMRAERYN